MAAATVTPTLAVSEWADRVRPHLVGAVEHIVAAGQELLDAKASLPHGSFGPLLDELGLSRPMAGRFMRVAANQVLAKCSPVSSLPAAVSVLDTLTRLDPDELEGAIGRGEITAATTRAEAEELISRYAGTAVDRAVSARQAQYDIAGMAFDLCRHLPRGRDGEISDSAFQPVWAQLEEVRLGHDGLSAEHVLEGLWVRFMLQLLGRNPDFSRPWPEQVEPRRARPDIPLIDPATGQRVGDLRVHPVLHAIPITEHDVRTLTQSIAERGVLIPVRITPQGVLLDGRLRLLACHRLGITDYPRELCDLDDFDKEAALVMSLNMLRSHYTEDQRAVILADLS